MSRKYHKVTKLNHEHDSCTSPAVTVPCVGVSRYNSQRLGEHRPHVCHSNKSYNKIHVNKCLSYQLSTRLLLLLVLDGTEGAAEDGYEGHHHQTPIRQGHPFRSTRGLPTTAGTIHGRLRHILEQ